MSKKVLTPFNQWERENRKLMEYRLKNYDDERELLFYTGFDAVSTPAPREREIVQQVPIPIGEQPEESVYSRLDHRKMEALYPTRDAEMIDRGIVPEFIIGKSTRLEKEKIKRNH